MASSKKTFVKFLPQKKTLRHLIFIFPLLESSEEISKSSVIYLMTFFFFSMYSHLLKKLAGNSFHLFKEINQ